MFKEVMIGAARAIGQAFVEMTAKAVQGVGEIVKAGVAFNAKMEQYETGFKTLLGSAEEAQKVMSQIREDAARTPFDVDSLTQANQMLISAGISAEDARGDVLNLANAIAATGGGSAELSRMAANMQQVKNVGKATAMDIRQFAMAGINIYGLLADATGKSTEEVKEMEVSYDLLTKALANASKEGGMYAGAMEAQSQTLSGRISTLKDNATQLAGALTEDLFNTLSGEGLPMVMDWVATLLDAAQTGGIEGALAAAKDILSNLLQGFLDGLPEMMDAGVGLLTNMLTGLAGSGAVSQIMAAVLTIIRSLLNAIVDHLPEILAAGITIIMQLLQGLYMSAGSLVGYVGELIVRLFNAFLNADWKSIGQNVVKGIGNGIAGLWDGLVSDVKNAVNNLWESAKRALGIASPSKKFAYIGEMSVEGTMEGFEDREAEMTRVVHDIYTGMSDTAMDALRPVSVAYNGYGRQDIEREVSYTLQATGTTGGITITVPFIMNDREFARATAWSMGEQLAWEEI
ncbi:MAG: tape measure protein [Oscillospiraceae bacterium]|nr:tape measure protein [Oscillospiraceae bacterium]